MGTDRIEKTVVLRAPRSRVWRAIADAEEFGTWFGVKLQGRFTPGARVQGQVTIPGYEHVTMDVTIERVDPERLFSWRWHPAAVEPGFDYSAEPTTLVEFRLEEVPGGTRLTVTESGFDRIPLARRAKAYEENEGGWAAQLENIARHVSS
jgi:uncharacterized protein YndB with AHSA1/START domain